MANKITVKFEAQGARALKTAIDQLHLSQVKLEKGTKAYKRALSKLNSETQKTSKGLFDITNKGRLVQGSFATLRSQLLLASFAFGIVNATVLKLGRTFGEQEQAEKRLSGLIGKSSEALQARASELQKNTRFGDEQTLGAMSLVAAYTTEESAIAQLTQAAMDLATVKGMDLNTATDMLSKSVFSSTNSMSRYGVEIEGAAGSGARLNSALKAISAQMGGASERDAATFLGAMDQMNNAVGDLAEVFGKILAPAILIVADGIKFFAEQIDEEQIKSYGAALATTGTIFLAYTHGVNLATAATNLFTKATKRNLVVLGATVGIAKLIDMTDMFANSTEDVAKELDDLNKKLAENKNFLKDDSKAKREAFDRQTEMALLEAKHHQAISRAQEIQEQGLMLDLSELDLVNQLAIAQETRNRLIEKEEEGLVSISDKRQHKIKMMESEIAIANIESKHAIKAENDKQKAIDKTIEVSRKALRAFGNNSKELKAIDFGLMMVNAYKTATNTRALLSKTLPPPFPGIIAAAEFAATAALASQAQKFETGGLVGGRRHSQGGTLIEAERGEFVMSRNAVQSIGVDNLEAMNQGGSAVNITITGNVMTSDFVEGELAEKIRDAVRTGTDFGMS